VTAAVTGTGRVFAPVAAARGTVVLLPGRGEHAGVYERYGQRLVADGYRLHVLDTPSDVPVAVSQVDGPVVLAGSDTGALHALALAGTVPVQGLLLAGVPTEDRAHGTDGWAQELEARTACPVHRARLTGDSGVRRGSLAEPVPPTLLDAAARAGTDLPVLLVHGGFDVVSPVAGARALARRLPRAELVVVRGGRHDILNDASHRSVAAYVVQWLERLRTGADAPPILDVERIP
jgi:alpha-beta hydrolase superfamily lysophospholipase